MGDRLPDRLDAEGARRASCCRRRARIAVKAGYPPDDTLVDADIAAASWAWEHNRAGRARRRYAAGRQAALSAAAHRPRAPSA